MATVLLLRHGRTTANADGGLAGRRPVELDDTGRAQSAAVGRRLRGLPLAAVVSSPLIRCRQTLELALPELVWPEPRGSQAHSSPPAGTPAEVEERLTECGYGDWEGQPLKKLAKDPLWKVVQQHPSAVTFPDGEAMAQMSARAVAAVRDWDARVTAEHGPQALWLACSHGDVIKAIVADALGVHLDLFQRVVADPASLTVIRYTPGRPFLVRLNDTGGDLSALIPPRRRRGRARPAESDAAVGGGAGGGGQSVAPKEAVKL
ncbi:MAG TPA: histidine phosphatase family protein [Micromonosporaceae bacterium]|nr:histidine phosphatase family protein [Micromonosporaceae bacterium]